MANKCQVEMSIIVSTLHTRVFIVCEWITTGGTVTKLVVTAQRINKAVV